MEPSTISVWLVRQSAYGATRIRYVQSIVMNFVRDYQLYHIQSLAIIRLGTQLEYEEFEPIFQQWLAPLPIPIVIYDGYEQGVKADEAF